MTTRRKKVFVDSREIKESLIDGALEESPVNGTIEKFVETPVEDSPEVEEHLETVAIEKVVEEVKVEVRQRPPAPAKRKISKNSPKFSSKIR